MAARNSYWLNNDGLVVGFGTRKAEDKVGGVNRTAGSINQAVLDWGFGDLPTTSDVDNQVLTLPANAQIVSSKLYVVEAAAGGTSYAIGLSQPDGTVIDADGLHTDAQLVTANLVAGAWLEGSGALVGLTIGANPGQITVGATGTFTAGKYRLIVEYIQPKPVQTG